MKKGSLTVIASLLVFSTIFAQTSVKSSNQTSKSAPAGQTWAVVIGVSKYQNIKGLDYADRDALAFYDYLKNKLQIDSSHIQLLTNEKAIATDIYGALDWLNLSARKNDRVIFYFSGHGDVETKTLKQNGFLLANDAPVAAYMTKGAISVDYLQDYLETYVAKDKVNDVLLIVDACRSGTLAGGSDGMRFTMHALGQEWNNQIIKILSAQEGESSFEDKKWGNGRGVFSYYLVKAFEGLANKNADSVITTAELQAYLPFVVGDATGSKQNPNISGNPRQPLFSFNNQLLALARKDEIQSQGSTQLLTSRGQTEELDPQVDALYTQYRSYLQKGRLIKGELLNDTVNCAKYYYNKLVGDKRAQPILPSLKSSFVAFLQHKTDVLLNDYLAYDGNTAYNYEETYKEMLYAKSLVDNSYILYNYISARVLFEESGRTNDPAKAIKLLKQVIKLEPDAAYAYNEIGKRFGHGLGNADSAIYYYKKALTLAPALRSSYGQIAMWYEKKRDYKASIPYRLHLINLLNEDASLENLQNLAGDYFEVGNTRTADSLMQILEKKVINFKGLEFLRSRLLDMVIFRYAQMHQVKKADGVLSAVIELLKPTQKNNNYAFNLYESAADLYLRVGLDSDAVRLYEKAVVLPNVVNNDGTKPSLMFEYNTMSFIYLKMGDFSGAAAAMTNEMKEYIASGTDFSSQDLYYKSASRDAKGVRVVLDYPVLGEIASQAAEIVKKDPAAYGLYYKIAEGYHANGDDNNAIKYYNLAITQAFAYQTVSKLNTGVQATNLLTGVNTFYNKLARVFVNMKDFETALTAYNAAITLNPKWGSNYYEAACVYALKGDMSSCLQFLKKAFDRGFTANDYGRLDKRLTNVRQTAEYMQLVRKYSKN